ncbi:hypothetical protein ACLOJK_037469 [Asimina triloba]
MQKNYWFVLVFLPVSCFILAVEVHGWHYKVSSIILIRSTNCHKVGYAPRRNKKKLAQGSSPEYLYVPSSGRLKNSAGSSSVTGKFQKSKKSSQPLGSDKWNSRFKHKLSERVDPVSEDPSKMDSNNGKGASKFKERLKSQQSKLHERSPPAEDESDQDISGHNSRRLLDEYGEHRSSPGNKSFEKDSSFSSSHVDEGEKQHYHVSKGVINHNMSSTCTEAYEFTVSRRDGLMIL